MSEGVKVDLCGVVQRVGHLEVILVSHLAARWIISKTKTAPRNIGRVTLQQQATVGDQRVRLRESVCKTISVAFFSKERLN